MTESTPKKATKKAAYLPTLPDGYGYAINIEAPDGEAAASIITSADGSAVVEFYVGDESRTKHAETLADAVRVAADGVKALGTLHKHEENAKKAREDALSVLGDPLPGTSSPASTSPSDQTGDDADEPVGTPAPLG